MVDCFTRGGTGDAKFRGARLLISGFPPGCGCQFSDPWLIRGWPNVGTMEH
jgi:hypothetical protein